MRRDVWWLVTVALLLAFIVMLFVWPAPSVTGPFGTGRGLRFNPIAGGGLELDLLASGYFVPNATLTEDTDGTWLLLNSKNHAVPPAAALIFVNGLKYTEGEDYIHQNVTVNGVAGWRLTVNIKAQNWPDGALATAAYWYCLDSFCGGVLP